MNPDPKEVERLRKDGQTDEYIAWMLGCEVKDLPLKTPPPPPDAKKVMP